MIINGKRYEVERARSVAHAPGGSLYIKRTGEYFLFDKGKYTPLTYDEAEGWHYENVGGALPGKTLNLKVHAMFSLSPEVYARIADNALRLGTTMSEYLEKLIISTENAGRAMTDDLPKDEEC